MKTNLTAILLLALMSCSKNDPAPFNIVGHWTVSSPTVNGSFELISGTSTHYSALHPSNDHFTVSDTVKYHIAGGGFDYDSKNGNSMAGFAISGNQQPVNSWSSFTIINGTISSDYKKITVSKYNVQVTCYYTTGCIKSLNKDVTESMILTRAN